MTKGKIPSDRYAFSAVLGLDGQRVIIYGGTEVKTNDSLYELSVNNWEWSIPRVSGSFPKMTPYSHRANVVGGYMIVTFGNYIKKNSF